MRFVVAALFAVCLWYFAVPGTAMLSQPLPANTLFYEDWESGMGPMWSVDHSMWEVGVPDPSVGPGGSYSGIKCAGTVLDGNYPNTVDGRLILNMLDLSSLTLSPEEELRLYFFQWHEIAHERPTEYDDRQIQIRPFGGNWTTVSGPFVHSGLAWSRASIDLTSFVGQVIDVGFLLHQNINDERVAAGWYIDDVSLEIIVPRIRDLENFELGWDQWWADNGMWQVGTPVPGVGPDAALSGTQCAGTVLDDNYPNQTNGRLVSPSIDLTNVGLSPGEEIRLYFFQWHAIAHERPTEYDARYIQVRPFGGNWTTVSGSFLHSGGVWSRASVDLTPFVGQTIEVGFLLYQNINDERVKAGWYIDDVSLEIIVPRIRDLENFELGWDQWWADNGMWQVGTPVPGVGPDAALSGTQCAGTVLDDNYPNQTNGRLVSPSIDLTNVGLSPGEEIRLYFFQWHAIAHERPTEYDDRQIQVRPFGGNWTTVSGSFLHSGGIWSRASVDLTPFVGQTIEVGFLLYQNINDERVKAGWYIDDVSLEIIVPRIRDLENFELGWDQWWADNGMWQVGTPVPGVGPDAALSGTQCAGTVLDDNYPNQTNGRLVSPSIDLTNVGLSPGEEIRLYFFQWHAIAHERPTEYDARYIQVRPFGGNWTTVSGSFLHSGGVWSRASVDLTPFVGQTIEVGFLLYQNINDERVKAGWYIDDVSLEIIVPRIRDLENFELGWDQWWADNGMWQVGTPVPGVGPDAALSGTQCAGTVLDDNYPNQTNGRLVSPSIDLSCTPMYRPALIFWHWHSLGWERPTEYDAAVVQVRPRGGSWQNASGSWIQDSNGWSQVRVDLSMYAGQVIELGFLLSQNVNDERVAAGWYVDKVYVSWVHDARPYRRR